MCFLLEMGTVRFGLVWLGWIGREGMDPAFLF